MDSELRYKFCFLEIMETRRWGGADIGGQRGGAAKKKVRVPAAKPAPGSGAPRVAAEARRRRRIPWKLGEAARERRMAGRRRETNDGRAGLSGDGRGRCGASCAWTGPDRPARRNRKHGPEINRPRALSQSRLSTFLYFYFHIYHHHGPGHRAAVRHLARHRAPDQHRRGVQRAGHSRPETRTALSVDAEIMAIAAHERGLLTAAAGDHRKSKRPRRGRAARRLAPG